MVSEQDVIRAREVVSTTRLKVARDSDLDILLCGMSVALCWVMHDSNGSTLQDLIDGRLVPAAKGASE